MSSSNGAIYCPIAAHLCEVASHMEKGNIELRLDSHRHRSWPWNLKYKTWLERERARVKGGERAEVMFRIRVSCVEELMVIFFKAAGNQSQPSQNPTTPNLCVCMCVCVCLGGGWGGECVIADHIYSFIVNSLHICVSLSPTDLHMTI